MENRPPPLPFDPRKERIGEFQVNEYEHRLGFQIAELVKTDQELFAALGAMLSRDPGPLVSRVGKLTEKMKDRIIGRFFRNYGHSSIGEMGHLCLTVENISMIGAFQTIAFERFSGQEASTRYIDFRQPNYLLPTVLRELYWAHEIVQGWFRLYADVTDMLLEEYHRHGIPEHEAEPMAFDISGAFLPIAARTSVVLTCDIRNLIEQAWNLQSYRRYEELEAIGTHLLAVINAICPNSVKMRTPEELIELEEARCAVTHPGIMKTQEKKSVKPSVSFRNFDLKIFREKRILDPVLKSRLEVKSLGQYGVIGARAEVSFRSLRDLYRHRPFAKSFIPVLHMDGNVFAGWYLKQIPHKYRKSVTERAKSLLVYGGSSAFTRRGYLRHESSLPPQNQLYLLPMGVAVRCEFTSSAEKWLYLLRLRSGSTVHPEVRTVVQKWMKEFARKLKVEPERLGDMSPNPDYTKRSLDAGPEQPDTGTEQSAAGSDTSVSE